LDGFKVKYSIPKKHRPRMSDSEEDAADFDMCSVQGHIVKDVVLSSGISVRIKCVNQLSPIDSLLLADSLDLTGHTVWKSAHVMLRYFDNIREDAGLKEANVLELGSGTGLVGVYLAKVGCKSVTLSDFESSTLDLIRDNIDENNLGDAAKLEKIDWTSAQFTGNLYDMVVASDCVYDRDILKPLFQTAFAALKKEAKSQFVVCNCQNRLFCGQQAADELMKQAASDAGFKGAVKTIDVDKVVSGSEDLVKSIQKTDQEISLLIFSPV